MGLDVFDAIALTLHAHNNSMDNRTTIQKLIYFHTEIIKDFNISDYVHHFYGPFSREVATALEDMSEFSYVIQNVISGYYETYRYTLTDSGIEYANDAKQNYPNEFETITKTLNICDKHCSLQATPLSYAAKAYYILSNSDDKSAKYSPEDVKTIARYFDWEISSPDAQSGLELLQNLGLVSQSK